LIQSHVKPLFLLTIIIINHKKRGGEINKNTFLLKLRLACLIAIIVLPVLAIGLQATMTRASATSVLAGAGIHKPNPHYRQWDVANVMMGDNFYVAPVVKFYRPSSDPPNYVYEGGAIALWAYYPYTGQLLDTIQYNGLG